jgi:cobalt-zinc-cadmium efflux system membrane fusion protein
MLRSALSVLALSAASLLASCSGNDDAGSQAAAGKPAPPSYETKSEPPGAHPDNAHAEGEESHAGGEPLRLSDADIEAAGIRVEEAKAQPVADQFAVAATVHPDQSRVAHVAPKVAGRILRVHVRLGDPVRAGQTLVTIDSIEVGDAQAAYIEARTQLDLAQANWERSRQLFEEQIIAEKDWLHAQAERDKARAAERAAAGKLRLLGVSRPASDGETSSQYTITSPLSGTVIELHEAVQGELAKPEENLLTVADLSRVWVQASLPETDLGRVRVGAPAAVEVAAYPGERFRGRVAYVSSVLDKETRTLQARIEVQNPKGRLKVEMFATAFIDSEGTHGTGLVVPRDAIVLMEGKPVLFVHEDGAFEPRNVELGQALANGTVVRGGVEPGERVVVAGSYALKARILKSQMGEGHVH